MADGDIQLKISANAGTAVAEMRKVETATAKSAAAAKRLGEANKKAAEQSKQAWRGVQGPAGQFMQGGLGGFGMASLGLTAAVAGLSKLLDNLQAERMNATKGEGLVKKDLWEKQLATWTEAGKVSGMHNKDAEAIVQATGIKGEDLQAIVEKLNEHKMPATLKEVEDLSKTKVTFNKLGFQSENLVDLWMKAKGSNPVKNYDPLAVAKVAAFQGTKELSDVTPQSIDSYNKEVADRSSQYLTKEAQTALYDALSEGLKRSGRNYQLESFQKAVSEQGGTQNANLQYLYNQSGYEYLSFNPAKLWERGITSSKPKFESLNELANRTWNKTYDVADITSQPMQKQQEELVTKTMERVVDKLTDKTIKYTSITIKEPQSQDYTKGANR